MSTIKHLAEGRPLRAPLHSVIVHFPLGFLLLGGGLNALSWFVVDSSLHLVGSAAWATLAGLASGLLAVGFGFVDYTSIRRDHRAKKTATRHMVMNLVAVALFAVALVLEWPQRGAERAPALAVVLSFLGVGALIYSSYLGGDLVYADGVGVGRHRRSTDLPKKTHTVTAPSGDYVRVCETAALPPGQILRVSVNGNILAVALNDGRISAVQEFCTHRFGPLSEGALREGCIECPWHRSRFRLNDGGVAEGPATVALKTVVAELREGAVWIKAPPPV